MIVVQQTTPSGITITDEGTVIFGKMDLNGARVWCFTFKNQGAKAVTITVEKSAGGNAGPIPFAGLTQTVAAGDVLALEFGSESCQFITFIGTTGAGLTSENCLADFIGRT